VAQRGQQLGGGQAGRPAAHHPHGAARIGEQAIRPRVVLVAEVGRHALEMADGHRLAQVGLAVTAGCLAGPGADVAQHAGNQVGGPIDEV